MASSAFRPIGAELVDSLTYELRPVREIAREMIHLLQPVADELECRRHLDHLLEQIEKKSWAQRQLDLLQETGDLAKVVRHQVDQSRLSNPV